ncbi:MAG: glutamate racemase [Bacteroidales bacterium]|nr:glutamate racemase [Bacteroidales bacterium]
MIGVFDSGSGGLSVLREMVKAMPSEEYVYFSDNAHCPYGEKSPEYIRDRARSITERLLGEGCDIIVVACNTATAAAIGTLRKEYSNEFSEQSRLRVLGLTGGRRDHVRFIGMEPAVKPAALRSATGVIGVLATAGTLKGSKYLTAKGNYHNGCRIVERVGKGFVELVESLDVSGPHAGQVVRESLQPLLDEGADTIVLGCTHYPFLLGTMQKIAGPSIRFIDPAPAVTRRLMEVMQQDGIPVRQGPSKSPKVLLLSSGPDDTLKSLAAKVL